MASVSGIKGKKNPTLLLAELLQIEGEMAVMQYDTGATASLVFSNFIRKLNLFSRPKRVQISITSGIDGGPEEALMHEAKRKCTFWTVPGGGENPEAATTSS